MRKFTFILLTLVTIGASAQKTTTTTTTSQKNLYQFTEARMPQVLVEPLVKPIVAEVKVIEEANTYYEKDLSAEEVDALQGKVENIYNYGIFCWTKDAKCDMIVAATYNFFTNPNPVKSDGSDAYKLEIKGFPAKFVKWRDLTPADYDWMRIRHEGANNPVVKPIK